VSKAIKLSEKYLMPTCFGPACGPRQTQDGSRFINQKPTFRKRLTVKFLTEADAIKRYLPAGLVLQGEAVVSIQLSELKGISWLAGRGYNILSVQVPVRYTGSVDDITGPFLMVLCEQLGYPKLYAEVPDISSSSDNHQGSASW